MEIKFGDFKILFPVMCCSGSASLSDDVELKLWFLVLLHVIHCLFRSLAHPAQPQTWIQDMLDMFLLTHVEFRLMEAVEIRVGKGNARDTLFKKHTTDGTSQHGL